MKLLRAIGLVLTLSVLVYAVFGGVGALIAWTLGASSPAIWGCAIGFVFVGKYWWNLATSNEMRAAWRARRR